MSRKLSATYVLLLGALAAASILYLLAMAKPTANSTGATLTANTAPAAINTTAANVETTDSAAADHTNAAIMVANQAETSQATYFVESGLPAQTPSWNVTYDHVSNASSAMQSLLWTAANPYPAKLDDSSCISYNGYAYCIAGSCGANATAYYAQINSDGTLGNWTATNPYPSATHDLSCNAYNGNVYCVGGDNSTGSQNAVYYAPILSSGIGHWTASTPYPTAVHNQACSISGGYIYCVGGDDDGNEFDQAYYARILTSNEVGSWIATTPYPYYIEDQACDAYNGYIYCVGGWAAGGAHISYTYFAPLSSEGIGTWTASTPYPINTSDHKSCSISNGYIYCAGGYNEISVANSSIVNSTYYAPVSQNGFGAWLQGQDYPGAWRSMSAISYNDYVYYIGGYNDKKSRCTNSVYYAMTNASAISFSTGPGTYAYTIANQVVNGRTYTPSPSSGTFAAGNALRVRFSQSGT